jgi:hypothetical protein
VTWFAWRTQRLRIIAAVVATAVFIGWLYVTGSNEHTTWSALVAHHCITSTHPQAACNHLWSNNTSASRWTNDNIFILNVVPALLGLLFGAPLLALEIEHGTNRFAWSQSITRSRWLAYKLAVGVVTTAVLIAVLIPVVGWWVDAVRTGSHVVPETFDIIGITQLGYGLFAFMLGAALGVLIRRTGWSAALGIAIYGAVRLGIDHIRVHFAPLELTATNAGYGSEPANVAASWVQKEGLVPIGRLTPLPGQTWNSQANRFNNCVSKLQKLHPKNTSFAQYVKDAKSCGAATHLHLVFQYQPVSHFWRIQSVETAIYVIAALVLLGVTVLAVRRWRT